MNAEQGGFPLFSLVSKSVIKFERETEFVDPFSEKRPWRQLVNRHFMSRTVRARNLGGLLLEVCVFRDLSAFELRIDCSQSAVIEDRL